MCMKALPTGVGLGWRPETAWAIHQRPAIAFTEVIAERVPSDGPLPPCLADLVERGTVVLPHGVSLSLGSGEPPSRQRLDRLARVVNQLGAPMVSEHVAFVRGGGHETEHLLPVPRTREALAVVVDNVRRAQDRLPVELVLENIAHLLAWPGPQMDEAEFLAELAERTGCRLLLDVSNLHANCLNFGWDLDAQLAALPLDRIAYAHIAGGVWRSGFYHDTHAHPVGTDPLDALARLVARRGAVPVLLERDNGFGTAEELFAELDAIELVLDGGRGATPEIHDAA
jgi:uncharacterized protein